MTLEQLRIFLEVARLEHITNAARSLNMTQSAVSAAISALERRHDIRLFDRVGRGIELTASGRRFHQEAAAVMRRAQEAEGVLAEIAGKPVGALRIAASQTVASYWLPPHLVRFHEAYPDVALSLASGNTASSAAAVRERSADLGIVEGEVESEELELEVVATDRLALVVGSSHPWADGRTLTRAALLETSWIMREPGSGTRAAFEADLRALDLPPESLTHVIELPSNEACLAAVRAGRSATVVSNRAAEPHLVGGDLCRVRFDFPERTFTVLTHAERHRPKSVLAMLTLLRNAR